MKRTLGIVVGGIAMAGALAFPAVAAAYPAAGGAGFSQDWRQPADSNGGSGMNPVNAGGFHWWCGGPVRDVVHPFRCIIGGHGNN